MSEPRDPERDPREASQASPKSGASSGDPAQKRPPGLPGSDRLQKVAGRVQGGGAYGAAFEAVLSIVIAIGIGYWAETRWGFSPWGVIGGVVLGFAAFVLRLVRLGSELNAENAPSDESGKGSP